MSKFFVGAVMLCLLAGCAMPDQAPRPKLTAAQKACRDAPPPTGSHISDESTCGKDPFMKHGYIANRSGSSVMDQDTRPPPK